jgi:hypothetical protein
VEARTSCPERARAAVAADRRPGCWHRRGTCPASRRRSRRGRRPARRPRRRRRHTPSCTRWVPRTARRRPDSRPRWCHRRAQGVERADLRARPQLHADVVARPDRLACGERLDSGARRRLHRTRGHERVGEGSRPHDAQRNRAGCAADAPPHHDAVERRSGPASDERRLRDVARRGMGGVATAADGSRSTSWGGSARRRRYERRDPRGRFMTTSSSSCCDRSSASRQPAHCSKTCRHRGTMRPQPSCISGPRSRRSRSPAAGASDCAQRSPTLINSRDRLARPRSAGSPIGPRQSRPRRTTPPVRSSGRSPRRRPSRSSARPTQPRGC